MFSPLEGNLPAKMTAPMNPVPLEIAPEALSTLLASDRAPLLVDCREPWEHETARLGDSLLIPLGEVPTRVEELPKDRAIVVYCHHGVRSRHAALVMRHAGYELTQSLAGGIDAWSLRIDPTVPRY